MTDKKKNHSEVSAGQNPADENASENEIIEGELVPEDETTDTVSARDQEINQLAEELQQAQTKAKEYYEGWQRERADFSNYKRRVDRDQQTMAQNIKGDVVKRYLPILDDLERAMKARPNEGPDASWANGIELVIRKLQAILELEGVQRIPAETELFNPTRHEAITHEDSPDHKSGEIIEVVQQGYTLGDRILRPAMVRVARG